jgi:hypothetical protein
LIKKNTPKCDSSSYGGRVEWGYPNPVGYGFGVLVFIPVENWNGFEDTRTLWV